MGVFSFFSWLSLRYPKILINAKETNEQNYNYLLANANIQSEVDNLYFDMNQIIHRCCHPMDRPKPTSIDQMFNDIFDYVDKVIRIIQPNKLIYLAIDGVPPRAKMHLQRERKFRAALELLEINKVEEDLFKQWKSYGLKDFYKEEKINYYESSKTSGSGFMELLSDALDLYISHRLQFDTKWKDRTVIFSNASVPGEGEQKVLDFIRTQRSVDTYDPNVSHCIYGADSDLILLSLIAHEPNFIIIRESNNEVTSRRCDFCRKSGHYNGDCPELTGLKETVKYIKDLEFCIIKITVLREYLYIEFKELILSFTYDFERVIDDFVLLCLLVGNDFLPNLLSLKIKDGGLDALLFLYKNMLPKFDGYLTDKGKINLERIELILKNLALIEDDIFKAMIAEKKVMDDRRNKRSNNKVNPTFWADFNKLKELISYQNKNEYKLLDDSNELQEINKVESNIKPSEELNNNILYKRIEENPATLFDQILKDKIRSNKMDSEKAYVDDIKLGESGWKERYYKAKFSVSVNDFEFIELIKTNYIEGLCWVFEYYYNGCPSWDWYYAFHYAPFVSDLVDIKGIKVIFNQGTPFEPVEHILAVSSPASSYALPECLRYYMHNPNSEIADFYPSYFVIDIKGHSLSWMGVNLIPFVEDDRIHKLVKQNKHKFTEKETLRNTNGSYRIYTSWENKESNTLKNIWGVLLKKDNQSVTNNNDLINNTDLKLLNIKIIKNCNISSFSVIQTKIFKPHSSNLKKGVKIPRRIVIQDNLEIKYDLKAYFAIELIRKVLNIQNSLSENVIKNNNFERKCNKDKVINSDSQVNTTWRNVRQKQFPQPNEELIKTNQNNQNLNLNLNNTNEIFFRKEIKEHNNDMSFKKENELKPKSEDKGWRNK